MPTAPSLDVLHIYDFRSRWRTRASDQVNRMRFTMYLIGFSVDGDTGAWDVRPHCLAGRGDDMPKKKIYYAVIHRGHELAMKKLVSPWLTLSYCSNSEYQHNY